MPHERTIEVKNVKKQTGAPTPVFVRRDQDGSLAVTLISGEEPRAFKPTFIVDWSVITDPIPHNRPDLVGFDVIAKPGGYYLIRYFEDGSADAATVRNITTPQINQVHVDAFVTVAFPQS